jgi:hypothetical protein
MATVQVKAGEEDGTKVTGASEYPSVFEEDVPNE